MERHRVLQDEERWRWQLCQGRDKRMTRAVRAWSTAGFPWPSAAPSTFGMEGRGSSKGSGHVSMLSDIAETELPIFIPPLHCGMHYQWARPMANPSLALLINAILWRLHNFFSQHLHHILVWSSSLQLVLCVSLPTAFSYRQQCRARQPETPQASFDKSKGIAVPLLTAECHGWAMPGFLSRMFVQWSTKAAKMTHIGTSPRINR